MFAEVEQRDVDNVNLGLQEGTLMRLSRLVLTSAAIGTILGTARADLNRTHVFNSGWPPHARVHTAAMAPTTLTS